MAARIQAEWIQRLDATMNEKKLQRNIWLIFLFSGSWAFLILMPVIIPFFMSRGLDMQDVFLLQAFFSATLLLFELPSGYVADLLGRRKTLLFGSACWGAGFSIFPFVTNFWSLLPAEFLMALGVSLISGTDVAVIYDSLNALGSKKAPIKVLGKKIYYQQIGETIGGLLGGWLALWSLGTVVWAQAAIGWAPLIVAFFVHEPDRVKMQKKKHRENFAYIYRSVFKHSRLLTLIVLNNMFYGVVTLLAVWTFQQYWQNLGVALIYFGYIWAISNLSVAVVARYAHKIEKRLGSETVLVLIGLLPVIGFAGMAWMPGLWGIAFCLCFQVTRGLNSVILRDALNSRVTGDLRATANSIAGLGMRLLFIILGPIVGYFIDFDGLKVVFLGLGGMYVLVFFALIVPMLSQRRSFIRVGKDL